MANILTEGFDYTYNGTLLTEVMFKPSVTTPALSDMFRIIPGSSYQIEVPLSGVLSKLIKAGDNCNRAETGSGLALTNQTVDLKKLKMFVQECAETFETSTGNIIAEMALKDGRDVNDISGTEVQRIIDRLLEDSLRRDLFRIVSFSDTNDADTDYNQLDGLWTTLIANSGQGSSYCVRRTSTALGTGTLSAGQALASLKEAYEESNVILKQVPISNKAFYVTGSIYENLLSSYESITAGSEIQVSYQVDGIQNVKYRGIRVIPVYAWDESLADSANPLNGTVEHLILYTTRENHVLGVQNTSDLNRIRGWYSLDDDIYNFDSKMRVGYNYLHCDLQTIAY